MQPEMIRIASFNDTSSVFLWVLWHQTGAQYSAGANASVVVEVRKVSNEVPQLVPDSFFTSATREDTFCFSLCKWFLYVRLRSRVIPRYVGISLTAQDCVVVQGNFNGFRSQMVLKVEQ